MENNQGNGFAKTVSQIFNFLFLGTGFLLFVPTGLLLLVAMYSVFAYDWMELVVYAFGALGLTMLVGITALVPNRFFAMLGMFIAQLLLVSFGSSAVGTALTQVPPSLGWVGTIGMAFALTITHSALWAAVRSLAKVEPAPAKTATTTSALAGTALKTTKP
jgi:hypothetical protein